MPLQPLTASLESARRFLDARFRGRADDIAYVGEGTWSRFFGFALDGREFVIRFGRHVDDFRRDRFASQWSNDRLPIPTVEEIGECADGWYAISERAHGTALEQLDATEWQRTLPSILTTLDELRMCDLDGTSGFGGWDDNGVAQADSWPSYLATVGDDPAGRRTHGWRARLDSSPLGTSSFERGFEQMMQLAESTPLTTRHLVHNDLLNRNALAEGGRVSALFDWGCSIYGDFLYDLATFAFWSPWYPVIEAGDIVAETLANHRRIGLDVAHFDDRLRCCAIHIGLDHIGYSAFLGDHETQLRIDDRMADFDGRRRCRR